MAGHGVPPALALLPQRFIGSALQALAQPRAGWLGWFWPPTCAGTICTAIAGAEAAGGSGCPAAHSRCAVRCMPRTVRQWATILAGACRYRSLCAVCVVSARVRIACFEVAGACPQVPFWWMRQVHAVAGAAAACAAHLVSDCPTRRHLASADWCCTRRPGRTFWLGVPPHKCSAAGDQWFGRSSECA